MTVGHAARKNIKEFQTDECGAVYSVEQILMTVVFALGMLAGLAYFRDGLTQEMGDIAVALESLDRGFEYTIDGRPPTTHTDDGTTLSDPLNAAPAGLSLADTPPGE